ncbi:3-hydroxyacyl-CoA dehydrogenase family protein [Anaerosalibacter bizertensis]|uniref:3-hydroxyacyl-CoA dehydrogenase family protein n=1 Tax=Anaerosalibacter bizertensis TaxID=932217 RepID=A0A844FHJ3_9FIRM|nr:3-hydroxyacyl-CoA dehydrogenase family protein [Anaerosalibacter bizertensis]MBV1817937.1 3-hydroxyacyl-CoA dehydrogenase family protein [Bacteroidales bacterium MSK.15.36]HHV26310.1 3-hydroxyacyl-CoA dehydrogenase family protein [Tissierellia bacterium]MBU5294314.1 3-hydroxyacyl-CoA dehydrogenase family protein [Anaerosalibacter bizertensis]MCB5560127.1 3-hydroxyacyl-CoA dehydrogenase family protein [Anaerosalibacter bizertensis]MCG4565013.1 3-hydroxyacyl-CoA dehydrogenase family protein [
MKLEEVKKIGVAGAGTMGAGIAQIFAQKGYEVVVTDIGEKYLENAKKIISINNSSLIEEKLITESEAENAMKKISFTTDKKAFSDADVIIEAIIEKIDIKQDFWKEVEEIAKEDAIFATNTSGLSITEISEKVEKKGRFIGMHWWNPPHIIPLIEIIRGKGTDDETVDLLVELVKAIDREPVVVQKDANGFIGNRIQFAVFREALNIVEQGIATVEDVDRAMKYGLGFRYAVIGPFETADLGGLDTFYYISSYLFNELGDAKEPSDMLKDLVDNNNLGVKSKKGFYDYSNGKDEEAMKNRDKMFFKMLKHIHNA